MKKTNINRIWLSSTRYGEIAKYHVLYNSGFIRTYNNGKNHTILGTIKEFIKNSYVTTSIDGSRLYTMNNL